MARNRTPTIVDTREVVRDGQTFTVNVYADVPAKTRQEIRLSGSFRTSGPKTRVDKSAKVGMHPTFATSPGHVREGHRRNSSAYVTFG